MIIRILAQDGLLQDDLKEKMRLEIDNFDGAGVCVYSAWMDASQPARVVRKLNRPAEMWCAIAGTGFVAPSVGARVALRRNSGEAVFTGYVDREPEREHLGWGQSGGVYRYPMHAIGGEWLLDRERLPQRPMFVMRTAGEIVRQMTASLGLSLDIADSGADALVTQFGSALKRWPECARQVALPTRSAYSVHDGKVRLRPVGERAFTISEADETFSPERLKLRSAGRGASEVTVLGKSEPDAYVKDYFLGDAYDMRFYLSQFPFGRNTSTIFEQEYEAQLDSKWWTSDGTVSVNSGRLWMQGAGLVEFAERVEVKGALTFQHGEVQFQAASNGAIGGLYEGAALIAGFRIANSGEESRISAVIQGVESEPAITTQAGHRYLLSTRLFATETVREGERYHSTEGVHGGGERPADARVVLEVHDIDPNNPASLVSAAAVLYDGVVADIPALCRYVLLDGADMHCSLAYTRMLRMPNVLVRSALPGQAYRTRLVGAMVDGAECRVYNDGLQFYSGSVPASDERIVAEYRGARKAVGVATAEAPQPYANNGLEAGAPTTVAVEVVSPAVRTSEDCANAAQAILDDASKQAWAGEYETWPDFVEGDPWPGDQVQISAPSFGCEAPAIVREVEVKAVDPENDRSWYSIRFANEAAEPIAMETNPVSAPEAAYWLARAPERFVLENLPHAEVTAITSTSVTIDTGVEPIAGGGVEVRRSDSGWDPQVDRNLVGRFQTRVITVPRLSRAVTFCLRQYDGSNPVKYSRCATQLHVDYPL